MTNRLVIGAASGMGEAVARRFARLRQYPEIDYYCRTSQPSVSMLARELGAEHIRCDITSDTDVAAIVGQIGEIDAAVLTAGLSPTMASGRTIVDVNLTGTARVAETLLPHMRNGGALVCFRVHCRALPRQQPSERNPGRTSQVLACTTRWSKPAPISRTPGSRIQSPSTESAATWARQRPPLGHVAPASFRYLPESSKPRWARKSSRTSPT